MIRGKRGLKQQPQFQYETHDLQQELPRPVFLNIECGVLWLHGHYEQLLQLFHLVRNTPARQAPRQNTLFHLLLAKHRLSNEASRPKCSKALIQKQVQIGPNLNMGQLGLTAATLIVNALTLQPNLVENLSPLLDSPALAGSLEE